MVSWFKIEALLLTFLICIFLPACKEKINSENQLFIPVSPDQSGITFSNTLLESEDFNIIEYLYFYNGGGVAIGDINNDGLPDIYLSSNQGENKLYLNKDNLEFEDITINAGVASPGQWKTGVTMADVNGDGLLDIYVCRVSGYKGLKGKNELYINRGDLTFIESAEEYGLDFQGFSTQAAFFDYDRDGDLDMYLLNHSVHTEKTYGRASLRYQDDGLAGDKLYRNNAEKGLRKFSSVTHEAGIFSSHIGYGLGVGMADINGDGWPDLYISNDFNENDYLYLNDQDGTFREMSQTAFGHGSRFSMGNDLADFNNDGWIDIIAVDMLPEDEVVLKKSAGEDPYEIYDLKLKFGYGRQVAQNTLQLNNGDGSFSEIAQVAGVQATDWSWTPLFADFDLDGWKDLFISNGIQRRPNDMDYINFISNRDLPGGLIQNPDLKDRELIHQMPLGKVHDYFFKNNGDLTFTDVSTNWGMTQSTISNGAAYADLDNDGDLDLIINHINQPAGIFKNLVIEKSEENPPSFLKIKFKGKSPNSFAIGAKVTAYHQDNLFFQENYTTRGFQSSVSPILHFGLGKINVLDSLTVQWPGGKKQTLYGVKLNQSLEIIESEADPLVERKKTSAATSFLQIDSLSYKIKYEHFENDFNDFNQEYLIPHKISREGPTMALGKNPKGELQYLFIGGAEDQAAELYVFDPVKGLLQIAVPEIAADSLYEDIHAVFFDSNQNGHLDLYVVSAGNKGESEARPAKDRLYINDGNGNFSSSDGLIPEITDHGSIVLAEDFDGDGWVDLFVGGRTVPGHYGKNPRSYLLKNSGDGFFEDVTDEYAPDLRYIGMVKDALWIDLDRNGWMDLVLVGEWMPITVMINEQGHLQDQTEAFGLGKSHGWWNTIIAEDLNQDGYMDLVAGNLGLNSKLKTPVHLYLKDFDNNGKTDPIITYSKNGQEYPVATKEELIRQIPSLRKKFVKNEDFAGKNISDVFGKKALEEAIQKKALEFQSMVFINRQGEKLEGNPLPIEAQFSPVEALLADDLNGDGFIDLILGGNYLHAAPYYGPYDASGGLVLFGNGENNFTPLTSSESGLSIRGDIKDFKIIENKGKKFIFIIRNDMPLLIYQVQKE